MPVRSPAKQFVVYHYCYLWFSSSLSVVKVNVSHNLYVVVAFKIILHGYEEGYLI